MNPNPYQPPQSPGPYGSPAPGGPGSASPGDRPLFVLAAIGAGLASVYWAGLTLLIGLGAAFGSISPLQVILPVVLIALYAARGVQIWRGDRAAARRILWLHGFGAISAVLQMSSGGTLLAVLQGIKILIHIFGGVTAFLAQRSR